MTCSWLSNGWRSEAGPTPKAGRTWSRATPILSGLGLPWGRKSPCAG
jgi:hypothetical protein